jgi:uncharacterized protein (TIGR02117 family)
MRRFFKGLGALAAFGFLALVGGTLLPWPLVSQEAASDTSAEILIITNPIHTDIAIQATPEALKKFAFLRASGLPLDAPGLRWIVFGWGGRAFYVETPAWSQLKAVPVLKALTLDSSVMHVAFAGEIDRMLPNVKSIPMSAPQLDRINSAIAASFLEAKPVAIQNAGYGENDRFFEAIGGFNVLLGCNTWAARVLRAGGFRTGIWNPLPQSLVYSLELYNSI